MLSLFSTASAIATLPTYTSSVVLRSQEHSDNIAESKSDFTVALLSKKKESSTTAPSPPLSVVPRFHLKASERKFIFTHSLKYRCLFFYSHEIFTQGYYFGGDDDGSFFAPRRPRRRLYLHPFILSAAAIQHTIASSNG